MIRVLRRALIGSDSTIGGNYLASIVEKTGRWWWGIPLVLGVRLECQRCKSAKTKAATRLMGVTRWRPIIVLFLQALPPLSYLHVDWLRIAEWVYAGMFAVAARFQNKDHFWIPHLILKPQNELVWPVFVFLCFSGGFRFKNWSWSVYKESLLYTLWYA